MVELLQAWGYFMPFCFFIGVLRVLTDMVMRAFTRGGL